MEYANNFGKCLTPAAAVWRLWLPVLLLFNAFALHAEGIRQVAPNPDDRVMLLIGDTNYANFASATSPESSRLYVNISSASEILYLGLSREYTERGTPQGTGSYSFSIRRASDNQIVHGPFSMNSLVENISTWEQSVGPAILNNGVGYSTEDARFRFSPGQAGLYYVEFANCDYIGFWDFTVADNGVAVPGRVYSKNWAFRTPVRNNTQPECAWDRQFNGALYSYTTDGFVTRIDFQNSGFQGLSFTMAFNSSGPGETGDIEVDRMSIPERNIAADFAEHLIFLQEPDAQLYPDGVCGEVSVAPYFSCTGTGTYCLDVAVTRPGQVEIMIDINGDNLFDPAIDRRIIHRFDEGASLNTCMNWDGLLADGTPVDPGININLIVNYTQGAQHWAVFDGEYLKNGFCVAPIRPICSPNDLASTLYWDDRNIVEDSGTGQPRDGRGGCDCETVGCRTWNNFSPNSIDCTQINDALTTGYGDKNIINTWWFANIEQVAIANVPLIRVEIVGESELCMGNQLTLDYQFFSFGQIATATWSGPNGVIATLPDAPNSIEVTQGGTYTLTVVDVSGCVFSDTHIVTEISCDNDLELDITASTLSPVFGTTVGFTITVTNAGEDPATDFSVVANWPAAIVDIAAISNGGILTGNTLTWSNLSLLPGGALTLTFSGTTAPALGYTISAEVATSAQADIDSTPGNGVDTNNNGNCADDPGDEDDGDCVVLTPPACGINVATTNAVCDPNGTLEDPTDDTYSFAFTVTGSNTATGWTAQIDGQVYSGSYNVPVSVGPFPIASGSTAILVNDAFYGAACATQATVQPPATCSDNCVLLVEAEAAQCSDAGTNYDPSDDTFSFRFRISGANTGAGWTASDGSSGQYGEWYTYTGYAIADGDVTLVFSDQDAGDCSVDYTFEAPLTCSPDCRIVVVAGTPVCFDNGTPSDGSDDTFTFTVNATGWNTSGSWVANDANASTGGYNTPVVMGPYPIGSGDLNMEFRDAQGVGCTTTVSVQAPATCSDLCHLTIEQETPICNDNGTPTLAADDTYTVRVRLTAANGGNGWTSSNGQSGLYGQWEAIGPFPIAGGNASVSFVDNASATCLQTATLVAPPACSNTCDIEAVATNVVCSDAGTPSDPSDDTFTFSLTVTGVNTAGGWIANDPLNSTGDYSQVRVMGPYSIAAGNLEITITDTDDLACTAQVTVAAPNTCSNECAITAIQIGESLCDPNGTVSDDSDDTFSVTLVVSGSNTGSGWTASNGQSGVYNEPVVLDGFPIAGGDFVLVVRDNAQENCVAALTLVAPETCSDDCFMTGATTAPVCSDNGTPSDPSDDTYTFAVTLEGFNLGDTWLAADGTTGTYGTSRIFGPYPISQGDVTLVFTDAADAECTYTVTAIAPATCSGQCAIAAAADNYQCSDNGTPFDPSDDTYTFDLTVTALNAAGASWIQPNGNVGLYGVATTQGPFAIGDGAFTMTIQDVNDPNCTASVTILPTEPCSESCLITVDVSTSVCDDNGTPEDGQDDTFEFMFTVNALNAQGGWIADNGLTGSYGQPTFSSGHRYADGVLTITITDSQGRCATSFEVVPPVPVLTCPPDTDERIFSGSVQIIRGELDEQDILLPDAPCFLNSNTTPMSLGDRFMEPIDINTPSSVDTSESVYTFYFFSEMDLPAELAANGNADGVGMLFRGDYTGYNDPCCFLQSYTDPLDMQELIIENPFVDTTGMFDGDMVLAQRFTQLLKPGQEYSLVTTTYGSNITGRYAWVIVSEQVDSMVVNTPTVTSEFLPQQPLLQDLTHLDIIWAMGNPSSLAALGNASIDPLCGVDSLYFLDTLNFISDCDSATITRSFVMEHVGGAEECDQIITFRRPEYEDIVLPPATFTYQCEDDIELNANGFPHPNQTGYPLISAGEDYIRLVEQVPYFNLAVSYKDIPLPGNDSLILNLRREWTVVDACEGDTLYTIAQSIKIGDFDLPTLSCPLTNHFCPIIEQDIMLFGVDPFACTATVEVPVADFRGFCTPERALDWTVTTEVIRVSDSVLVETLLQTDARYISNLERGDYFIRYIAQSIDGRTVEHTCRMRVADLQVPSAICRSSLTIYVDESGEYVLPAESLDLGSYDNCDDPRLFVRRFYASDTLTCSPANPGQYSPWSTAVPITCCDVDQTLLLQLRVMDLDSNINGCNVLVHVRDTIAPLLVDLETRTLDCAALPIGFDPLDSLQRAQVLGMPTVIENCDYTLEELNPELSGDECTSGTIRRRFIATDKSGNASPVYEQLVQVNRVNSYAFQLPKDEVTSCIAEIPALNFVAGGCGDFEISYEDIIVDEPSVGCLRVQRNYTIINHCTYGGIEAPVVIGRQEDCSSAEGETPVWVVVVDGDAYLDVDDNVGNAFPEADACSNPQGYWRTIAHVGAWEYTQFIDIVDETPPVLVYEAPEPVCAVEAACEARLVLPIEVVEACLPEFTVVRLFLDAGNDGTVDSDITASHLVEIRDHHYRIDGMFPIGYHALVVEVKDACQNTLTERIPFQIADCFIAAPICAVDLQVNLNPVVPAADLDGDGIVDEGAYILSAALLARMVGVDCSGPYRYSVNRVGEVVDFTVDNLILTCEDRYTASREVVVRDFADNPYAVQPDGTIGGVNYSRCTVTISVQDEDEVCTSCTQNSLEIEGIIRDRLQRPMDNVAVNILVDDVASDVQFTVVDGKFEFADLAFSTNYRVRPHKNDDTPNGVTTLDLILLQRHLLLLSEITNPYVLLAADINGDGQVTTLDLLFMQQLILDRRDTWPNNNTSWRFLPTSFPLTDISATIPDSYTYFNLIACQFGQDFIGIKVGDLNGSANPGGGSLQPENEQGRGVWPMNIGNQSMRTGELYRIPVTVQDLTQLSGLSFELAFTPAQLTVLEVEPGIIGAAQMNTSQVGRGIIKGLWLADADLPADGVPLFTLVVKADAEVSTSDAFSLKSTGMSLAYDQQLRPWQLGLSFPDDATELLLLNNVPDPFHEATQIGFHLPKAGTYTLDVTDVTGRLLFTTHAQADAGYHQVTVDGATLPTGFLYYTLRIDGRHITRKMVKL